MFHVERSELKALQPLNAQFILVTFETSHRLRSSLNSLAYSKSLEKLVTSDTSQSSIGPYFSFASSLSSTHSFAAALSFSLLLNFPSSSICSWILSTKSRSSRSMALFSFSVKLAILSLLSCPSTAFFLSSSVFFLSSSAFLLSSSSFAFLLLFSSSALSSSIFLDSPIFPFNSFIKGTSRLLFAS